MEDTPAVREPISITSNRMPGNNAAWIAEKSQHVAHNLARLVDLLRQEHALQPALREFADEYIGEALHNATKLWAFADDASYTPGDWSRIAKLGEAGYEELKVRYGFHVPTAHLDVTDIRTFQRRLGDVLAASPMHERERIAELVRRCPIRHQLIDEIIVLADEFARGLLAWNEFRQQAHALLHALPT